MPEETDARGHQHWRSFVKEGHDGGATTHALCGVVVLDCESLGFARRYSPRSFDVLYLSSWVAQVNVTGKCKYTWDAHFMPLPCTHFMPEVRITENDKHRQASTYESWG
jgi:hypothetical protein